MQPGLSMPYIHVYKCVMQWQRAQQITPIFYLWRKCHSAIPSLSHHMVTGSLINDLCPIRTGHALC
jgi:hypothetical protein